MSAELYLRTSVLLRNPGVGNRLAPSGAVATAAKQEQRSAGAALPWVDPEVAQHVLLQKSVAMDSHGGAVAACGALHFFRLCHGFLLPLGDFALLLNGFTVPDSSESGAMWFSCENPANFLRIWNRLR
jgi:hypothetical protein